MNVVENLKLDENGLISAIIQHYETGKVLMLGYMKPESLKETIECGKAVFFSRSRQVRWMKGETSGHVLNVKEIFIDCDLDALVITVDPIGPTCHTNHESCFYRKVTATGDLEEVEPVVEG